MTCRFLIIVISLCFYNCLTASPQTATTHDFGIHESRFVTLGGIDQWITIHGAKRSNPVLLVLHGGPGDAQSLLRSAYAVYEKDFTIVQWDQRGAGKTYAKNPNSPPEPERVEMDGMELAQYLCNSLSKQKILLLGILGEATWGSE